MKINFSNFRLVFEKLFFEEKFLIFISLFFFIIFSLIKPIGLDLRQFIEWEFLAFRGSFLWFFNTIAIIWICYICFYWIKFLFEISFTKNSKIQDEKIAAMKQAAKSFLRHFAFLILLAVAFSCEMMLLFAVTDSGQKRLVNEWAMSWDKIIFGAEPFLWFHMVDNRLKPFFDLLAEPIIFCFLKLSTIMGASVVLLFWQRKIFAGMIISYFLAMAFALPIWYAFPVNSPNNYFLSRDQKIAGYEPVKVVADLQQGARESQKDSPPISTFPSAHVMWGMETAYFWALYRRQTMLISIPWLLLMTLGTVYLAQHWAIDVLAAIPLAILAIFVSQKLVAQTKG